MHSSNIWVSISLFCHSAYWSDLLTEGIQPFVGMLNEEMKLLHYQVAFNWERGDNIRFALLVEKGNAEETAMYTDYYFKLYFSKIHHINNLEEIHHNGMLMNFPTNSIQYSLFTPDHPSDPLYNDPKLQQELSVLLIQAVKNELVTKEAIVMLAFHLYLTLHAVIVPLSEMSFDDLVHAPVHFSSKKSVQLDMGTILKEFERDKMKLFDITHYILKQDESLPGWCRKWRQLCENKMKSLAGEPQFTVMSFYEQMACLIDTHLGLSNCMKFLVFHFIKRSTNLY